jgi:hypothetical protein
VWHDEVASKALSAIGALIKKDRSEARCARAIHGSTLFSLVGPMIMGALWQATLAPVGWRAARPGGLLTNMPELCSTACSRVPSNGLAMPACAFARVSRH